MIDALFRLAVVAAGAVGTYLLADAVTNATTGKHIHEHAYALWCGVREKIQAWLAANQNTVVAKIVGRVTCLLDDAMVTAKTGVNFVVEAETATGQRRMITEEVMPADEVRLKFPGLQFSKETPITLEMLN